jgi:hypothetical protein
MQAAPPSSWKLRVDAVLCIIRDHDLQQRAGRETPVQFACVIHHAHMLVGHFRQSCNAQV